MATTTKTNEIKAQRCIELTSLMKEYETELKALKLYIKTELNKGKKFVVGDVMLTLQAGSNSTYDTKQMVADKIITQETLDKYKKTVTFDKLVQTQIKK